MLTRSLASTALRLREDTVESVMNINFSCLHIYFDFNQHQGLIASKHVANIYTISRICLDAAAPLSAVGLDSMTLLAVYNNDIQCFPLRCLSAGL